MNKQTYNPTNIYKAKLISDGSSASLRVTSPRTPCRINSSANITATAYVRECLAVIHDEDLIEQMMLSKVLTHVTS